MTQRLLPLYLVLAACLAAGGTLAQEMKGENSRGVRVLEAEPEVLPTPNPPAPAPLVQPAPTPAPAPAPAPVVRPAPVAAPEPVVALKFCDRPFAKPDLTTTSAAGFDRALAAKLNLGRRVVVDLAQPYKDDTAAPAPIGAWLTEVKAGGGTVTVKEYCDAARGSLGAWLAELFGVRPKVVQSVYLPARKFNVILHADALDKVITQVEFAPKSARATL